MIFYPVHSKSSHSVTGTSSVKSVIIKPFKKETPRVNLQKHQSKVAAGLPGFPTTNCWRNLSSERSCGTCSQRSVFSCSFPQVREEMNGKHRSVRRASLLILDDPYKVCARGERRLRYRTQETALLQTLTDWLPFE